jgi:hypothetical protein
MREKVEVAAIVRQKLATALGRPITVGFCETPGVYAHARGIVWDNP